MVNGSSSFVFPLDTLRFNAQMPQVPGRPSAVEWGFQSGTRDDAIPVLNPCLQCELVSHVGQGADGSDISEIPAGYSDYGFNTRSAEFRLADDFEIPPGTPQYLDSLDWPVFQAGAAPGSSIQQAFVRVWRGGPPGSGGTLLGGDLSTNRLFDEDDDTGVYRVAPGDRLNTDRRIRMLSLDMTWVPALNPGRYWVEVGLVGDPALATPMTPPSPYPAVGSNALVYSVATGQWSPLLDQSGGPVDLCFTLFAGPDSAACYADCDNSPEGPVLNVNDFMCFLNRFAAGDPYANCDGSTVPPVLNVNDFVCFLSAFAAECP